MQEEINKYMAWTIALRGLITIIFGLLLMFYNFEALVVFVSVFGVFYLVDGFIVFFESFASKKYGNENWYLQLIEGIFRVLFGIFILYFPVLTSLSYVVVIQIVFGVWILLTGLGSIAAGFSLGKGFLGTIFFILLGIFLFSVGLPFVINPILNIERFISIVSIIVILNGIISLAGALLLKNQHSLKTK